uniref:Uncharacterized protein n=1 Tax=Strigamia maritima TaxID=126957 RepID=T1JMJ9_STRMM
MSNLHNAGVLRMAGRNTKLGTSYRLKKNAKTTSASIYANKDQTFLAAKIHAWATEEVKCCFFGRNAGKEMPSIETIKHLCRGRQMADMWDFITSNVVSREKVIKARGNLILHRQKQMSSPTTFTKSSLKELQQQMRQSLLSSYSSISQLEKSVDMLEVKMQEIETLVQEKTNVTRDLNRKICILEQMISLIDKKIRVYCNQIENFKLLIAKTEQLKQMENKLEMKAKQSTKVKQQCQEDVHKLFVILETHISQLTGEDLESKDAQTYLGNQDKQKLWISGWNLVCSYPIKYILKALLNMSHASINELAGDEGNINIEEDAKSLQFGYETKTGELIDKSAPREILQSVGIILQEEILGHVSMGICNEKVRNRVLDLQKELKEELKTLEKSFKSYNTNMKLFLPLTKSWVQNSLELVSMQAALMFLNIKQTEINKELEKTRQAVQEKELKLKAIQEFRKIKDEKHKLIRTHIGQNIGIHEWLNNLRHGICRFVRENLCNKYGILTTDIQMLWDCVSNQLDVLQTLPFKNLPILLEHNWDSSPSLSIYSLDFLNSSPSCRSNVIQSLFAETLNELKLPPFKSSEALLGYVLKCKVESVAMDCVIQGIADELRCKNGKNETYSIKELNDLTGEVAYSDETLSSTLLQELKISTELTVQSLQIGKQLHKDLKLW